MTNPDLQHISHIAYTIPTYNKGLLTLTQNPRQETGSCNILGSDVDSPGDVEWDEQDVEHEGHVTNIESQLKES